MGYRRWIICALLFAATAINYVDRQIIGVLKPTLQGEFQWSETDYASIVFWFQAAYALGYAGFGRVVDKLGARLGYAVAVAIWTIAHMAHGLAGSISGFAFARLGLGIGEAGNFPSALNSVAEWFPKKERALATGVFNAGSNIGAIVTPLIVPAITLAYGWRAAFFITGLFSFVWLAVWLAVYRRPTEDKKLSAAELAYITADPPDTEKPIAWAGLLKVKETWAYALGKFLVDPIWWMFLFWLPDFFAKRYQLDLKSYGPPLVAVYLMSDIGSVAGGWFSSSLMKRGFTVNRARKTAMLCCALLITPVMFAAQADNLWIAVAIVGLATAGHQGFTANLHTLPSDLFPRKAVGSVAGIGGTFGALGGMAMAKYAGWVLEKIGSYTPIFLVAGLIYFVAVLWVHLLSPRLEPVDPS